MKPGVEHSEAGTEADRPEGNPADLALQPSPAGALTVEFDVQPGSPATGVLIRARDDTEAVASWLARYAGSPHTLAAARKEAERLLLWLADRGATLAQLTVEDCVAYLGFLADPQPRARWCGPARPRHLPDGSPNPEWRPFQGALGATSVRHARTLVFGLYEYLCAARWLAGNPWRLLPRGAGSAATVPSVAEVADAEVVERFLPAPAFEVLLAYVDALEAGSPVEQRHHPRCRWVVALLYLTGARRSEVVAARMGHIRNLNGRWWWRVLGKGGKAGSVPLSAECMVELARYREHLGLSPLPLPGDETPLVCDVWGRLRPITASALYKVVKQTLSGAAEAAADPGVAALLRQASTHWLRHTAATDQLNAAGMDLVMVQKNLRHASIATTSRYLHADRTERHRQTESHATRRRRGASDSQRS